MSEVGRIEGALSIEFNECSIAAADANRFAAEHLRRGYLLHTELLEVIDDVSQPGSTPVTGKKFGDDYYLDRGQTGTPRLLGRVVEDMYVPLASFAHRPGSELCSYVQLGSEISDDSIVLGPKDVRMPYVEAVRHMLKTGTNTPKLDELREAQIDMRSGEIAERQPTALGRRIIREYARGKKIPHSQFLIDADSDPDIPREYSIAQVTSKFADPPEFQGRPIRFFLGRETGKPDLRLLAVVRTNVALTVARISDNGEWTFPVQELVGGKPGFKPDVETVYKAILAEKKKSSIDIDSIYNNYEYYKYRVEKKPDKVWDREQKEKCEKALKKALVQAGTYAGHFDGKWTFITQFTEDSLDGSGNRVAKKPKTQKSLHLDKMVDDLLVVQAFEARLGKYDINLESVLSTLKTIVKSRRKATVISGSLPGRKVGNTVVDVDAVLTARRVANGAGYLIRLAGRPEPMPDKERVTLFDGQVLKTRPSEFSAGDLAEISGALKDIVQRS